MTCKTTWSKPRTFGSAFFLACLVWQGQVDSRASDGYIVGFSEPYETVQVAAAELGIIVELRVAEGDELAPRQVIAALDDSVLRAALNAARAKAEFKGTRQAAEATLRQRDSRLTHMRQLHADGHASAEELERAEVDREIAAAKLVSAQEEMTSHALQVEQINAQLARRVVRSPIRGVVIKLAKRPGELVTTNDAHIATIVNLDRLRITFYVPTLHALGWQAGGTVGVRFHDDESTAPAEIEFVSPLTDADSDTVRIEVVLDNHDRQFRSGIQCHLLANEYLPASVPLSVRRSADENLPSLSESCDEFWEGRALARGGLGRFSSAARHTKLRGLPYRRNPLRALQQVPPRMATSTPFTSRK